MDILRSYLFLIPLIVMVCSEITKTIIAYLRSGTWHEGIFKTGGMPSSHSAFVTSLLIIVERRMGIHSVEFAIAFVFAAVVWYDAVTLRHNVGLQAEVLNRLQKWEHFTERVGHSVKEVIGGILFGIVVTWIGIALS